MLLKNQILLLIFLISFNYNQIVSSNIITFGKTFDEELRVEYYSRHLMSKDANIIIFTSNSRDLFTQTIDENNLSLPTGFNLTNPILQRHYLYAQNLTDNKTTLISINTNGNVNNDIYSDYSQAISDNGRYVVWVSACDYSGNSNPTIKRQIWFRDLEQRKTELISFKFNDTNMRSENNNWGVSITSDGSKVVFFSAYSDITENQDGLNLVVQDIQNKDRNGFKINGGVPMMDITINSNASLFAFATFVKFDNIHASQCVVASINQSEINTVIASVGSDNKISNSSSSCWLSSNGEIIAFRSDSKLVPNDFNNIEDIYVRDLKTNTTHLVSFGSDGQVVNYTPSKNCEGLSISDNGRFITWSTDAKLSSFDQNEFCDIYVHDFHFNTTYLITNNECTGNMNDSFLPFIQSDLEENTYIVTQTNNEFYRIYYEVDICFPIFNISFSSSNTPSTSPTSSTSPTPSTSPSISISISRSATKSPSISLTSSRSTSLSRTISRSISLTRTISKSISVTSSISKSISVSLSQSSPLSATKSPLLSKSQQFTSVSASISKSISLSSSRSASAAPSIKAPEVDQDCINKPNSCKPDDKEIIIDSDEDIQIPIQTSPNSIPLAFINIPSYTFEKGVILRINTSATEAPNANSPKDCEDATITGASIFFQIEAFSPNGTKLDTSELNNFVELTFLSTKVSNNGDQCVAFSSNAGDEFECLESSVLNVDNSDDSDLVYVSASTSHFTSFGVLLSLESNCEPFWIPPLIAVCVAVLIVLLIIVLFYISPTAREIMLGKEGAGIQNLRDRLARGN
eukprot:TRINITY_DN1499_c0_g6_i1.p1 TRINITY_DN1499_c0_g6~~TRINITY_DN1499_c0_g6_i1.p1  ORF type:complete len:802 (+),score=321.86 TRINITY_DN1499_c0_g6_i1:315-2720(+)